MITDNQLEYYNFCFVVVHAMLYRKELAGEDIQKLHVGNF